MEKNMKAKCSLMTIFILFTFYFSIVSIGTGFKLIGYNFDRQVILEDISKSPNEETRIKHQEDYSQVIDNTNKLYNSNNVIVKIFTRLNIALKAIWLVLSICLFVVDYYLVNYLIKREIKKQLKRRKRLEEKHSKNRNKITSISKNKIVV